MTYVPAPTGGHQTLIDRNFREPLKSGGWLNVRVYAVEGSVFKVAYSVQVSDEVWPGWMASVKWNAVGEPLGEVMPPTPLPEPEPIPGPGKVSVTVNGITIVTTLPLKIKVK
jgi:hypothetical protein